MVFIPDTWSIFEVIEVRLRGHLGRFTRLWIYCQFFEALEADGGGLEDPTLVL